MNEVGFLDFYIAALITGSILGMDRELLKKAAVRFLPVSFIFMACAALMAGLMGVVTGQGFRETIRPVRATAKQEIRNHAYAEFMGVGLTPAEKNQLVFSRTELLPPFINCNESMWEFFEPELNKRLSMMETDDSYAARVRSALMELLPGGECSIEAVAKKLGYSKHSLQRKLQEENTNFQKQLNHTRELLAKYYVGSTDMRAEDIAYLLRYQDLSSFMRSFSIWAGTTVSGFRQDHRSP